MPGPSFRLSILDGELLALTMSTQATPISTLTDSASRPEISALNRAGRLEMPTHRKCPPRGITSLECTLTDNGLAGSLECPVSNSLDLNFPGIMASWPFRGAEVLWRAATPVTPLECTDTKNGLVSPLECTDTNSLDLKSFRFHCYKKRGGGGCLSLSASPPAWCHECPLRRSRARFRGSLRPSRRKQVLDRCQFGAEQFQRQEVPCPDL